MISVVAQAKSVPRQLRDGAALTAACALALLVISVLRAVLGNTGLDDLVLPAVLAVLQLAAAAGLLLRVTASRVLAGAALFLTGLLHLVIALGDAVWWVRTVSALVLAASVAAGVLIGRRTA